MNQVTIIVVDGLGIGSEDSPHNTLASIGATSPPGTNSIILPILETLSSHPAVFDDVYSVSIMPIYNGADSYKGHYEMIGINVTGSKVFISEAKSAISNLYAQRSIKSLADGVLQIDDTWYISNNVEAELGSAVNLVADLSHCSWEKAVLEGRRLSHALQCDRVIVMGAADINSDNIKAAITTRTDGSPERTIFGIVPSAAGLYDKGYHSYHVGRALSSYQSENLLQLALTAGRRTALIGKVSDIFQIDNSAIQNFPTSDTKATYEHIIHARKAGNDLIFANFQSLDLMGHACNATGAKKALETICNYIDALLRDRTKNDLIIITADHGNDPKSGTSMHTREAVPFVAFGNEAPVHISAEGLTIVGSTASKFLGLH